MQKCKNANSGHYLIGSLLIANQLIIYQFQLQRYNKAGVPNFNCLLLDKVARVPIPINFLKKVCL